MENPIPKSRVRETYPGRFDGTVPGCKGLNPTPESQRGRHFFESVLDEDHDHIRPNTPSRYQLGHMVALAPAESFPLSLISLLCSAALYYPPYPISKPHQFYSSIAVLRAATRLISGSWVCKSLFSPKCFIRNVKIHSLHDFSSICFLRVFSLYSVDRQTQRTFIY